MSAGVMGVGDCARPGPVIFSIVSLHSKFSLSELMLPSAESHPLRWWTMRRNECLRHTLLQRRGETHIARPGAVLRLFRRRLSNLPPLIHAIVSPHTQRQDGIIPGTPTNIDPDHLEFRAWSSTDRRCERYRCGGFPNQVIFHFGPKMARIQNIH